MTDYATAMLIRALAGAQKIMVPRWLYDAIGKAAGVEPHLSDGIHFPGGNLPVSVGEYLPEDVMVIMERSGGLKAVPLERTKPKKEE